MKNNILIKISITLTLFFLSLQIQAQSNLLKFIYTGPTSIYVDNACNAMVPSSLNGALSASSIASIGSPDYAVVTTVVPPIVEIKGTDSLVYAIDGSAPGGITLRVKYKINWVTIASPARSGVDYYIAEVVVKDNIAPQFVASSIPPNVTLSCLPPFPTTVVATDNCGGTPNISVADTPINNICNGGTVTRIWTATDKSGNTSQAAQYITLPPDNIAPIITTQPQNRILECSANSISELNTWINANGGATTKDSCSSNATVTVMYSVNGGAATSNKQDVVNAFGNFANCMMGVDLGGTLYDHVKAKIDVIFIFMDACGNITKSKNAIFAVVDKTPPVFTQAAINKKVSCEANIDQEFAAWFNNYAGAKATDACLDAISYVSDKNVIDTRTDLEAARTGCSKTGAISVNFYAIDACGNKTPTPTTAIFTIEDKTAPNFVKTPDNLSWSCETNNQTNINSYVNNHGNATANDNCNSTIQWSYSWKDSNGTQGANSLPVVPASTCNWYVDFTFIASDDCGNMSSNVGRISISDTTAPVFTSTTPSDITINCDAVLPTIATMTATDNCTTNVIISSSESKSLVGACGNGYILTRSWVAKDACGNTKQVSQTITVKDSSPPVFSNIPPSISVDCKKIPTVVAPTVSDNCDVASSLIITYSETNTQSTDINSCNYFNYNIIRTWSSSDACGNKNSAMQTIIVQDIEKPTFTLPNNVTIECDKINDTSLTGLPTGINDNCDVAPVISKLNDLKIKGTCAGIYTLKRVWVVTDKCGNSATGIQTIEVKDTVKPIITSAAQDKSVSCATTSDEASAFNAWLATHANAVATDNCSGIKKVYYAVPNTYVLGDTTTYQNPVLAAAVCPTIVKGIYKKIGVDFIFTDSCGNATATNAFFNVIDNTPPTFSLCPANTTTNTSTNACSADATILYPTAVDECAGQPVSIEYSINGGMKSMITGNIIKNFLTGVQTITYTATDCAGNTNTCSSTITILDNEKPTLLCPNNVTANSNATSCNATINLNQAATLTDNCSSGANLSLFYKVTGTTNIDTTAFLSSPIVNFSVGKSTVTYIAKDAKGNASSCSYIVQINDITPPVAKCKNAILYVNPTGITKDTLKPILINDNSSDNCTIDSMYVSPNLFTCADVGIKTITLSVWDKSRNKAECTTDVKIEIATPQPSYSIGLCGQINLQLFANPPNAITNASTYTYSWTGPNGFVSNIQNPIINNANPSYSGSYSVTITGFSNCQSTGAVQVIINNIPNTPIINAKTTTPCVKDGVILSTSAYSGTSVKYKWYSGTAPNGTLLSQTVVATYTVNTPPTGNQLYYVVVEVDGCLSNPSTPISLQISDAPVAVISNPNPYELCIGDNIALSTNTVGSDYLWTGPNGYSSTLKTPPAIVSANTIHSGIYTLVVSTNGCTSATTNIVVNVKTKPATPDITSNSPICEGSTLVFKTNTLANAVYHWKAPDLQERITNVPILEITNATSSSVAGNWSVFISKNGCNSDISNPINVVITTVPTVKAANNSPLCSDTNVQLSATTISGANYSWSGPNSFTSNLQNPIIAPNAGTYCVTATTASGCSVSDCTIVSINPIPVVTAISDNSTPCVTGTGSIKLIPTVYPSNSKYQYKWTGPNNFASADSIPTLPNGNATISGSYNLIIKDLKGCLSIQKTRVINVANAPLPPTISTNNLNLCQGENLTLTATTYLGNNIIYTWSTPQGNQTTTTPSLVINNIRPENAGGYSVIVSVDACVSNSSGISLVGVTPTPKAPTATVNSLVCSGQSIRLTTGTVANASYEWLGPNGFTSSINNPTINNASSINEGIYKVRLLVNGCPSPYSNDAFVDVNVTPAAPEITNNAPACISNVSNPTVVLSVTPSTGIPGASYTWFNAQTNQAIGTSSTSLSYILNNFSGYGEGSYSFYAIANVSACSSLPSLPTTAILNTIPNEKADAGTDILICNNIGSVNLNSKLPNIGTGKWSQPNGQNATIVSPKQQNTQVSNLENNKTYSFIWTLSNGACGDYSVDNMTVSVGSGGEVANAGDTIKICNKTSSSLNAVPAHTGAIGTWTQTPAQAALGVTIDNVNNPNATITGLTPGNTFSFLWTLSNTACGNYSSNGVAVIVAKKSTETANAGIDLISCVQDNIPLAASYPISSTGKWSSPDASIKFGNIYQAHTIVSGIKTGQNILVWSLNDNICGEFSRDTLKITYSTPPLAKNDTLSVPFASHAKLIDVLSNDIKSQSITLTLKDKPQYGLLSALTTIGNFTYTPNSTFAGFDAFTYEICDGTCCSIAKVSINIAGVDNCEDGIPSIITPNNDGINDAFIIPCIATGKYNNNKVSIFNQWGDEVFTATPYKNDWMGTYKGADLPPSTYFYIIDFGNSSKKSGFLMIQR